MLLCWTSTKKKIQLKNGTMVEILGGCKRKATRWVSSVGLPSGIHPRCGICCNSSIGYFNHDANEIDGESVIQVKEKHQIELFKVGYESSSHLMVWCKINKEAEV